MDRAVPTADRLWNLHQVVPPNYVMRGVTGAYVYSINKCIMGSQCSSFDSFDKTSSIAVGSSALLQLVLRTTRQIAENLGKTAVGYTDSTGKSIYPVQVFLEAVIESEESAATNNHITSDTGTREKLLKKAYGIDVRGGELTRMDKSMAAITTNIPFLSEHRNKNVVGYRFWVFVFNSSIDFPVVMDSVMKLANAEFVKRTSATTLIVDNKERREYLRSVTQNGNAREGSIAAGIQDGGQFTMAHIVKNLEQWVLIYSREMFLNMIAVYLSDTRYMTPKIRSQCTAKELSHKENPASIGCVFGAPAMFKRPMANVDKKQTLMQNYFSPSGQPTVGGTVALEDTWTFPINSAVLIVLPEMQHENLCRCYLPDYQVLQVYTRLKIDDLNDVQSRTTDAENFGARANRRRNRAGDVVSSTAQAKSVVPLGAAGVPVRHDDAFDNPYAHDDDDDDDDNAPLPPDEFENFRKGAKRSRTIDASNVSGRRRGNDSDTDDEAIAQGDNPFRRNELLSLQEASARAANDDLDPSERSLAVIQIAETRYQIPGFETQPTIDDKDRPRFADVILSRDNIQPPAVLAQQKKIDDSLNGQFGGNTLIDVLARSTRAELAKCMAIENKQQRDCTRTIIQNRAFQQYADTATNPLSDISEAGCTINAFSQRAKALKEDHCTPALQFDRELSVFAHMMIQENTELDVLCGAHMCHRQLVLMQAVHFDCYRPTFDLHLNMINYAGPGRSKSFTLLVHEERTIPNTCKNISRLTAKALSSGRDVLDEFQMFHEIPRELIVDPMENATPGKQQMQRGGEQSQIDIFKTSLTEQVVITQENAKVDGVFTTVERKSVQHKTFAGNTNVSIQMIAAAIRSRVIGMEFNEVRRRDATMTDKEIARKNMTRATRLRKERCRWEFQMRQVCFYHLEKLFKIGALTEPDLSVFDIYAPIMIATLEAHGVKTPIRDMSKLQGLVRHFTVRHGLHLLYKVPNAPFVNKPFDVMQLKAIDPLLTATQEIVWFSIQLLSDQYIDPNRQVVLNALKTLIEPKMDSPAIFERYRRGVGGATGSSSYGSTERKPQTYNAAGTGRGLPVYLATAQIGRKPTNAGGMGSFPEQTLGAAASAPSIPHATWASAMPSDVRYDFNRVMLRISLENLSYELEAIIAQLPGQRLDREQISRQIIQLGKEVVLAKTFLPNNKFNGRMSAKSLPVFEDKTSKETPSPIIEVNAQDKVVTIHSMSLFSPVEDKMQLVIDNCNDRHTVPRKVLTGLPHAIDLPHLYKTVDIDPNPKTLHCFSTASSLSISEMSMIGSEYTDQVSDSMIRNRFDSHVATAKNVLHMNIDDYATQNRLDAIDLPREALRLFSFTVIEEEIRRDASCWVSKSRQFDYPTGVVTEKSVTEELAEIRGVYEKNTTEEARRILNNRVTEIRSWYGVDKTSSQMADEMLVEFRFKSSANKADVDMWQSECRENRAVRAKTIELLEKRNKQKIDEGVNPLAGLAETQRLEEAASAAVAVTDLERLKHVDLFNATPTSTPTTDEPDRTHNNDGDSDGGLFLSDDDNADPGNRFDGADDDARWADEALPDTFEADEAL
jgi:hypothetical protein